MLLQITTSWDLTALTLLAARSDSQSGASHTGGRIGRRYGACGYCGSAGRAGVAEPGNTMGSLSDLPNFAEWSEGRKAPRSEVAAAELRRDHAPAFLRSPREHASSSGPTGPVRLYWIRNYD